jgi:hypothetical protein
MATRPVVVRQTSRFEGVCVVHCGGMFVLGEIQIDCLTMQGTDQLSFRHWLDRLQRILHHHSV